jgi:hypothetical protein
MGTTPTVYALKNGSIDLAEQFKNDQEKNKTLLEIAIDNGLNEIAQKIIRNSDSNLVDALKYRFFELAEEIIKDSDPSICGKKGV